jgi:F-type H+-transporting ATPase subunit b
MPQLDYHTFVPQLVWLGISFVILYVLMAKLALPKVKGAIELRRQHLSSDLGRAAALKEEAEAALAAYQKMLAEARSAAQETLRQTGEKLAAEAAERQRQLAATLGEQIAAAESRIAAGAIVEKLTGASPDAAAMARAVGHALDGRVIDGRAA